MIDEIEAIVASNSNKPLCGCGCGKHVGWSTWHNRWNTYLKGHYGFKFKKGAKLSEQHKKKISLAKIGNQAFKGMKHTEATKKKMSESAKGKRHSSETKKKLSEINKGKIFSDDAKDKISISQINRWHKERNFADQCYCDSWYGGQGFEYRESIRKKECEFCGMSNEESIKKSNKRLSDIHIDGNKKDNRPHNIMTACCSCHLKFDWKVGNRI